MDFRKIFDTIPEEFDRWRPRYCPELFADLAEYGQLGPGKEVLEVGPGTGIRELLPDAKTIGIIYTTSEANSEASIAEYEAAVEEYGFTLETVGISTISEVSLAADTLLAKVDCLNNLTDNTVVQAPFNLPKMFYPFQ